MPLIDPVPLLRPQQLGPVHFIAVGGAGMSPIAAMYAELGIRVSGSDQSDSPALAALAAAGVRVHVGHDPAQLQDAATIVVSTAIRPDNPELLEAHSRGLRIWHRSAALAALMLDHDAVAVTGTHGKTTTTAMAAQMLTAAGADPSYVVGSPLASTGAAHHRGRGTAFVAEADESDGSFRQYPARIVVITNIEADHLDNWGTPAAYAAGFSEVATAREVQTVILSADDPGTSAIAARIGEAGKKVVSYGEQPNADIRLVEIDLTSGLPRAWLVADGEPHRMELAVPGRHNLHNAAAAYALGREIGLPANALLSGAASFSGTMRRFQLVGQARGIRVFDDYAHHPTEVAATLGAARGLAASGRVVACFQPHLFSRTRDFAADFGRSLTQADQIVVLGIYPAREDPLPGITGKLVADAAAALAPGRVKYVERREDAARTLLELAGPGDLVITLGAGDVDLVARELLGLLEVHQ